MGESQLLKADPESGLERPQNMFSLIPAFQTSENPSPDVSQLAFFHLCQVELPKRGCYSSPPGRLSTPYSRLTVGLPPMKSLFLKGGHALSPGLLSKLSLSNPMR